MIFQKSQFQCILYDFGFAFDNTPKVMTRSSLFFVCVWLGKSDYILWKDPDHILDTKKGKKVMIRNPPGRGPWSMSAFYECLFLCRVLS